MKKTLLFAFALTVSAFFAACSSDDLDTTVVNVMPPAVSSEANQSLFPEEGKAKMVSKNGAEALFALLKSPKFNMEAATKLHNATITDSQWNAIKEYVDKNLKGATETETYKRIFKWCHDSLTYTHDGPSLEPYDVFTNRRCICQRLCQPLQDDAPHAGHSRLRRQRLLCRLWCPCLALCLRRQNLARV